MERLNFSASLRALYKLPQDEGLPLITRNIITAVLASFWREWSYRLPKLVHNGSRLARLFSSETKRCHVSISSGTHYLRLGASNLNGLQSLLEARSLSGAPFSNFCLFCLPFYLQWFVPKRFVTGWKRSTSIRKHINPFFYLFYFSFSFFYLFYLAI